MAGYDSKEFSKQFSMRTEKNLEYIKRTVKRDELVCAQKELFLNEFQETIKIVTGLEEELRKEASDITNVQKKGKNELRSKLFSVASKLKTTKTGLEKNLSEIVSTGDMEGDELYEVTQLLNSLMGIAVLPYEMHKEYFQDQIEDGLPENNSGKDLVQLQDSLKGYCEYEDLQENIMKLYRLGKWKTTFYRDLKKKDIDESKIVFGFLRHMRNVTCHSGDNAMSILPLDSGTVIKEIIFYDHHDSQEFAMRISVEELSELVEKIAAFYSNTRLGELNKTKTIENAEKRAEALLKRRDS